MSRPNAWWWVVSQSPPGTKPRRSGRVKKPGNTFVLAGWLVPFRRPIPDHPSPAPNVDKSEAVMTRMAKVGDSVFVDLPAIPLGTSRAGPATMQAQLRVYRRDQKQCDGPVC
ncbi:MAG: hypothetical protein GY748_18040 [Planctomycetaceae bacterium]|nr:hypothetical protein [Planctomycetaceae bacterium]